MKVFVTGATGYIGSALVRALHAAGHDVAGLARNKAKTASVADVPVDWVFGNLRDAATFREAAKDCEALIHTGFEGGPDAASVDFGAIESLAELARSAGTPRALIYTSGIWVLGAMAPGETADESAELAKPARLVAFRVDHERFALDSGTGSTVTAVVRPGIVFGGKGGILDGVWSAVEKGEAPTVVGDGNNLWPIVHRADAADLYVRILEAAFTKVRDLAPRSRVFHATSPVAESPAEIARAAARAAGRPQDVRFWPLEEARGSYGLFADALALNQRVVSRRSEEVLGWKPRVRSVVRSAVEVYAEWKAGA